MKDKDKTKEQLLNELTVLRKRNAELEASEAERKRAEIAVYEARRYAESIVATVREPLLVLDGDLKILSANLSFYDTFKVTPGETEGNSIYSLGNQQWDIPRLRELLEDILPNSAEFFNFEVEHIFPSIGRKIMLLNARQIYREDIGTKMILLAIEDITERKWAEEQREKLIHELQEALIEIKSLKVMLPVCALNKKGLPEAIAEHYNHISREGKCPECLKALRK
jgi:PAS domain S-box-containing protein